MTEEEFLKSTPKKLFKLAEIHKKVNSPEDNDTNKEIKPKEVYIDNIQI